jgi:hypothetical protein
MTAVMILFGVATMAAGFYTAFFDGILSLLRGESPGKGLFSLVGGLTFTYYGLWTLLTEGRRGLAGEPLILWWRMTAHDGVWWRVVAHGGGPLGVAVRRLEMNLLRGAAAARIAALVVPLAWH